MAIEAKPTVQVSRVRQHGRHVSDRFMSVFIHVNAFLVVLSVILIFAFLIKESIPFFQKRSLSSFLFGSNWYPLEPTEVRP